MCISLIEIVKFYRHNPDAEESNYYTKEDFFAGNLEEYGELFENFNCYTIGTYFQGCLQDPIRLFIKMVGMELLKTELNSFNVK